MLELGDVAASEVYAALDWLGREQPFIEDRWPATCRMARCCSTMSLILEGRCCELAQHGYSRDTVATGRRLSSA
jgi:hypothetical protein